MLYISFTLSLFGEVTLSCRRFDESRVNIHHLAAMQCYPVIQAVEISGG